MTVPSDYGTEVEALISLLFGEEGRRKPAELRRYFEDGCKPLQILEGSDAATLLPIDVTDAIANARLLASRWRDSDISVVTPFQDEYPVQLRSVFDYPVLLFARGSVRDDMRSAAIVGSRDVSAAGLQFASDLARLLTLDEVTVVSGLARGVDGAAHQAALDAGGRTVAVLGNGLNRVYPAEHGALQRRIAETGLLLSQFTPDASPTRQSFPQRNITMSAYSGVTVIVEASEKSGTRIQADAAVKHGRPLVITRQVASETSWGREYAEGMYDVAVVSTPGEARRVIGALLERSRSAAELLPA